MLIIITQSSRVSSGKEHIIIPACYFNSFHVIQVRDTFKMLSVLWKVKTNLRSNIIHNYLSAGLVYAAEDDQVDFTALEHVTLKLGINPTFKVFYHFRALRWFHNGIPLTSGARVATNEDRTELSISNLSNTDIGVYEARFTGLLLQPYSKRCEDDVLDLLGHYPVLKPAVFHLSTGQEGAFKKHSN